MPPLCGHLIAGLRWGAGPYSVSPPAVLATCRGYSGEEMCLEIGGEIPT